MTQPSGEHSRISLRDRLQGLMVFRVALVTLFLGGTLAVDVETPASLSAPRNLALLPLIVATYGLTILYALLLERTDRLVRLAQFQIAADFAITAALVLVTNGLESIFLFLFYLNIINTAIVAGRDAALYAAGAVSAILLAIGALTWSGVSAPVLRLPAPASGQPPLYFEVAVDSVAAFLIALLSGRLAERLGETTVELEQKRVDLQKLRVLTENILASLDSGVVTVDESGEIIYSNAAAAEIVGVDEESLRDRALDEIFPDIAEQLQALDLGDPDATGDYRPSEARYEFEYRRPQGETIYLGYSVSVLRDSENRSAGHVVVFQDLTEIKRLQAEKERSQRLAAIGELAASIAHEIRNPLASISGSVEMLESVGEFDDEARDLMGIIVEEVERLDDLIGEFLEYSRPTELSREPVDLRELVEDVVELFDKRDLARDLEVDLRIDSEVEDWRAEIDRESIRQVLWNLLNNAADALDEIPDAERDSEGPEIRITLSEGAVDDRHFYDIVVEDAGPGIDEEHVDHLFEPFFTTKEHGTGLGLATSHRLVQKHGGQVRYTDDSGLGGAQFVIRLRDRSPESVPVETPPTGLSTESSVPSVATIEPSEPRLESSESS